MSSTLNVHHQFLGSIQDLNGQAQFIDLAQRLITLNRFIVLDSDCLLQLEQCPMLVHTAATLIANTRARMPCISDGTGIGAIVEVLDAWLLSASSVARPGMVAGQPVTSIYAMLTQAIPMVKGVNVVQGGGGAASTASHKSALNGVGGIGALSRVCGGESSPLSEELLDAVCRWAVLGSMAGQDRVVIVATLLHYHATSFSEVSTQVSRVLLRLLINFNYDGRSFKHIA